MTETALKFGPEWLRALSQGGTEDPPASTGVRYRLAEHRYGREEMLALFDRSVRPPDPLKTFSSLFIEKTQLPLALTQMTEEETRMWQRGVNSDAVLRLMGRGGPPSGTAPRGRGGSADRGRGRGRGGYYTRGLSFEDEAPPNTPYSRGGRAFERSQSTGVERDRERERGWGERNGVEEWNGATSPRKGFEVRAPFENWRTRGGGRTSTNWREDRDPESDRGGRERSGWDGSSDYRVSGSSRWDEHPTHHPSRRSWDDQDSLPEWATEKPGESSGSFDATGAFHGTSYSDEETDGDPHPHVREHHNKKELNNQQNPDRGIRPRPPQTVGNSTKKLEDEAVEPSGTSSSEGGSPPRSLASSVSSTKDGTNGQSNGGIVNESNNISSRSSAPTSVIESSSARSVDALSSESRSSPVKTSPRHKSVNVLRHAGMPTTPEIYSNSDATNGAANSALHSHSSIPSANAIMSSAPSEVVSGTMADKSSPFIHPQMASMVTLQNRTLVNPQLLSTFVSQPNAVSALQTAPVAGPTRLPPRLSMIPQQADDDLDSMKAAADDLVAKLMEEDDPRHILPHLVHQVAPSPPSGVNIPVSDKWFYRDPQGEIQGPFTSAEMADWYRSGYFNNSLLVRRGCDERFAELGRLIEVLGQIPFLLGPAMPPIKVSEEPTTIPNPAMPTPSLPHTINTPIPSASEQDNLKVLQHQYQHHLLQQQMLQQQHQQQQMLLRQATVQAVITKLAQTEPRWNSLSPVEQQQLVAQHLMPSGLSAPPPGPMLQQLKLQTEMVQQKNPLQAFLSQLHQAKVPTVPATESMLSSSLPTTKIADPVQQLIQQIALNANPPPPPPPELAAPNKTDPTDPIQSLLQQIAARNGPQPPVETLWGTAATPSFTAPAGWIPPNSIAPPTSVPPSSLPSSVWDLAHAPENVAAQEKQRLKEEEERRKEEEKRRQEEEEKERQRLEREREEQERRLKEEKRKQEELKRVEEEKRKQEEKRRKEEEKKKQQEEKKRQEELRKKLEAEERIRLEEERRKQEERKRKEEEERKRREEEKRQEEEEERRVKLEEEARRQKEEEERLQKEEEERRKAEKRQQEALRRLQEQQRAKAWNQASQQASSNSTLSLAEIQQLQEKEKKEKQIQHEQQQQQMQLQQLQLMEQQRELSLSQSGPKGSMNLKWADKTAAAVGPIKSLAEIQAEEEERMAKQLEKEKAEKSSQQNHLTLSAAGVWGSSSQNLSWSSRSTSGTAQNAWSTANNNGNGTGGFWDEATPAPAAPQSKQQQSKSGKSGGGKGSGTNATSNSSSSSKSNKNRSKKEEETVMKIFEQTVQRTDGFTQWCTRTLSGLQVSVDIPTFVGFLKDVESPYDVTDYVKSYLGDGKDVREFARQFLERRSKWRNSQKAAPELDDLCTPAPAVNPLSTDFCEVKGKAKKPKKGKMLKLDSRILGFSVTAATDRINIGERDYGEGV